MQVYNMFLEVLMEAETESSKEEGMKMLTSDTSVSYVMAYGVGNK